MREVSQDDRTRAALRRFGYDPDDPVPRSEDGERVIPDRLLDAIAAAPLLSERGIGRIDTMKQARAVAAMRLGRTRWAERHRTSHVRVAELFSAWDNYWRDRMRSNVKHGA